MAQNYNTAEHRLISLMNFLALATPVCAQL